MAERATSRFLDRTLRNLKEAWRDIALTTRRARASSTGFGADLPDHELDLLRAQMRECLEAKGGEVSARMRAAELGRAYLGLSSAGRRRFLGLLARDFDIDREAALAAAEWLRTETDEAAKRAAEKTLRQALVAPRLRLLTQFNALPEGVKFLVDLRAELMGFAAADASLGALDDDVKGLLAQWFDVGFLELIRITWDSPASLLEKLSAYEAVHAVRSWADLKNRLDSDRRCFAFMHPRMPNEPLIFVEVALVKGLAGDVQALLDENAPLDDPRQADTAIFYSISNAQHGLAGISFGGFLIKRVVDLLAAEFPGLATFATLSPMPGFRAWLDERFAEGTPGMLTATERRKLEHIADGKANKGSMRKLLGKPDWFRDEAVAEAMKGPLLRLAARYLLEAKGPGQRARDRVAHFHLSNGARVERLNWLADRSPAGMSQSAGLMVNYGYRLDDIEANHEAYSGEGRIATSSAVSV